MHKYKYIIIIIVVLIFAAIGWQVYRLVFSEKPGSIYEWQNWLNLGGQKACTMEAKLCPDGSYVGRTGPNCEFVPCPTDETANWQIYRNEEYGFEFKYPKNWPSPILSNGSEFGDGSYRITNNSFWKVNIGPIQKGYCEGEDCYIYYFEGFTIKNYDQTIQELKNNEMINIENETLINGKKTVVYEEGGICGNKSAFIFGPNTVVNFTAKCGDDDVNESLIFDQILSTIKFIK